MYHVLSEETDRKIQHIFSLIGSYSVGIVYQPCQTTLHLWDVSEECYRELIWASLK